MLSRNPGLVALPVVLDLMLWLGPRVSVAPLLQRLATIIRLQTSAGPGGAGQVAQAMQLLEQFGKRFNLLSLLSRLPMLHVPSLLARHAPGTVSPLGDARVFTLSNVLTLIPFWGGLILAGLMLGFLYLSEIARRVRAPGYSAERERELSAPGNPEDRRTLTWASGVVKFARFAAFAFGLLMAGAVLLPLWLLIVALTAVIAQPLGILAWLLGVGFASYTALHLIFVLPGILLGGREVLRAVWESVMLTRLQLSSVLGLVLLAVVIYEGLGYAWSLPSGDSWALLVGILGNACIATGLTAAAFVFYQERLVVQTAPGD